MSKAGDFVLYYVLVVLLIVVGIALVVGLVLCLRKYCKKRHHGLKYGILPLGAKAGHHQRLLNGSPHEVTNADECTRSTASLLPIKPGRHIRFETPPLRESTMERRIQPVDVSHYEKMPPLVTKQHKALAVQPSHASIHETMAAEEPMPSEEELRSSPLGWIQFSLFYDHANRILEVKVMRAKHLAAKDMTGLSDPYCQLSLLPDKHKMKTECKRKTLNPVWHEVFQFKGYQVDKLTTRSLLLKVFDEDRFSRDDPIGEVIFPMKNFNFDDVYTYWKELQPCTSHKSKGEIELGLLYDPDRNTMTVNIIKCRNLAAKDVSMTSDPYVKIWFLVNGERIMKYKTEVKKRTVNPTFDTKFDFPIEGRLKETALLISVMDYDLLSSNDKIGGILLSSRSGVAESLHWKEAFNKAKSEVKYWHELKGLEKLQDYFRRSRTVANR